MAPAVIIGGSGVLDLDARGGRHREVAGVGGVVDQRRSFGLMSPAAHHCGGSFEAAWTGGMEAVVELAEWAEVLERNPANRERFLAQDPAEFIETMGRWMAVYCPRRGRGGARHEHGGGPRLRLPDARVPQRRLRHPPHEATSERIVDGPAERPDRGTAVGRPRWAERQEERIAGTTDGLFVRWPLLVPQIQEWADDVLVR